MKFNTESDYEKYLSRMRGVAVQVEQGITLMREAIRLNRTNHAVSMVSMGDKGLRPPRQVLISFT